MISAATASGVSILVGTLAGCSSIPPERGYHEVQTLVAARLGPGLQWPDAEQPPTGHVDLPTSALTVDQAVRLAFMHNPAIRAAYARLGFSRADLEAAHRIANPSIGYARLEPSSGAGMQVKRSLAMGFTELLLLPEHWLAM